MVMFQRRNPFVNQVFVVYPKTRPDNPTVDVWTRRNPFVNQVFVVGV